MADYVLKVFGWCMTAQHDACRTSYTDWNGKQETCECKCHKEKNEQREQT